MPTAKKRAAKPHTIHDLLRIHIDSWARMSELIELTVKQRDAGNLAVARRTFKQAEKLRADLDALEAMVRPKPR